MLQMFIKLSRQKHLATYRKIFKRCYRYWHHKAYQLALLVLNCSITLCHIFIMLPAIRRLAQSPCQHQQCRVPHNVQKPQQSCKMPDSRLLLISDSTNSNCCRRVYTFFQEWLKLKKVTSLGTHTVKVTDTLPRWMHILLYIACVMLTSTVSCIQE